LRRNFMRDTYARQDEEISVVGAFVAGVTVGVIAGLLFAPRAGPDIRKSLQNYAAQAMNDILDTAMRTGKIYVEDLLQRSNAYLDRAVGEIFEPSQRNFK